MFRIILMCYNLQDVEEDEKERFLMSHSERLAIEYNIIETPPWRI